MMLFLLLYTGVCIMAVLSFCLLISGRITMGDWLAMMICITIVTMGASYVQCLEASP